jgi:hypothetical protein
VVSKVITAYQYGRIGKRFKPRHEFTYRCDGGLVAAAQAYANDWRKQNVGVRVLFGTVASGDALVDDVSEGFFRDVLDAWETIQAVEMEGAGAAGAIEACAAEGASVGFLMVRGISDTPQGYLKPSDGDVKPAEVEVSAIQSKDRDEWTERAACVAAGFVHGWISSSWPAAPMALIVGQQSSDPRVLSARRAFQFARDAARSFEHAKARAMGADAAAVTASLESIRRAIQAIRAEAPYLEPHIQVVCENLFESLERDIGDGTSQLMPSDQSSSPLRKLMDIQASLSSLEQLLRTGV